MTFQPITQSTPTASTSATRPVNKNSQPDLITRYNLKDKLDATTLVEDASPKGKAWSSSSAERQASLQKRREDMILAARRKMEAKLAAQKAASGM